MASFAALRMTQCFAQDDTRAPAVYGVLTAGWSSCWMVRVEG